MVLCSGEVEISTHDDQGRQRILARTGQLQVLGEMALLTDRPRSANAVAITPVRTLLLPAERFHELAGQFPELSEVLTLLLAERLGLPDRDDVLIGKILDRYRITDRLGRGGMSVVYDAHHVGTGQHVALKMMSHRLVYNQDALDQFQTEADLIQAFDHPNIVRMFGRFAAFHTFFIVMEFADGATLNKHIEQHGPLSETEFRKVFGQIVSALRYAHSAGVIHRDVKPANIMLTSNGVVKLMDFGLATPARGASSIDNDRVVGTPRYMAPEQMVGGYLTAEADLFSLGCVGYEMLTGHPLIVENDVLELLRLHANWQVPDVRQTCAGLSDDVCRVVQQCLPLDPADRRIDFELLASWAK
jgi:serine/threonine-protein kinase